ncbi:MAG: restriction endonuclease [Prevotella sp.]|nr:restriction endonuclease [Prevotella sp.]
MDSITRIKDFIRNNFPEWEKVDYSQYEETIDFRKDQSELYKINNEEVILISYTNIGITGTDRAKPQIRVFLDEYKKPFYFAKKHQLRFYLFSIFTKDDEMAKGLNNFNPKEYIISIETNLDNEDSRRDLRSIYDYANEKLNRKKFLKCTRANYKADINQASFIYIGTPEKPDKQTFESFINIFDSRPYINSRNEANSQLTTKITPTLEENDFNTYLTAIRTKPFILLAGISGTGKSRIVRELAFKSCPQYLQDEEGTTPGNYCMIEVKPNWHDSTELLGYYSNLSKGYQFKKFVMFLVKAKMFPKVPFFICLDEMNLAPVEHYFAEILSILETRKHPKIAGTDEVDMGVIKTDPIVEARYFKELGQMSTTKNVSTGQAFSMNLTDRDIYMKLFGIETENDIDEEVGKKTDLTTIGLTLPDNVIIIGTVNMDDTTHQFSRKVIDRAMTIEMNGGKLSDMYGGSNDLEYLDEAEKEKWQKAFVQRYVTADEVLKEHSEVADKIIEEVPEKLDNINKALKGTPFEVSYRVLNELTIMIGVMLDDPAEEGDIESIIDKALDRILLMKILPRIEGDADMFNLSSEFKKKNDITHENRLEWLKELAPNIVISEDEPHQQTAREKIQEMIERLGNQEFTRFWP